ncbi:MAG: protein kinase [Proteobacteria bacterium]|nr:protein kinase [Pseudomonadota bacterium]
METDLPQYLGKKYQLLDLIGTGGMAEVYRCKMSGAMGFEKLIVVKKLLSQLAHDPEIVVQFIGEARLAALLQHENIVCVYDFGEINGNYFIAMEYLFGKDLHSIKQRAEEMGLPMGAELALLIAAKLCEGMEYAHSLQDFQQRPLNIIHRDLSPHNIFVTYDGKVKIIDFGIARAELFDNRTKVGMVKGKISYMSPEQLTCETIDRRSDIFSIGILLYEMLCGKRMYSGDTATLIRKCIQVDFEKPEVLVPGLHPAVCRILERALAKKSNDRYESCAQMRADIEECLFCITERPATDSLQKYILRLFAREFEEEKKGIYPNTEEPVQGTIGGNTGKLVPENLASEHTASLHRMALYAENKTGAEAANISLLPPTDASASLPGRNRSERSFRWWGYFLAVSLGCLVVAMVFWGGEPRKERESPAFVAVPSRLSDSSSPSNTDLKIEPETSESAENQEDGVQSLLAEADLVLDDKPSNKSEFDVALNAYRKVLAIQPDNSVAQNGILRIAEQYGTLAEQATKTNNFSEAGVYIEKGLLVAPENGRLLALQIRLAEQRRDAIRKLADKAEEALQKNQLTTPANDCAHKYYLNILHIDGKNSLAMRGIQRIADRYAELAEEAYRNLNIGKSREYVRQGLAVAPQHRHLLQLQRDLTRSKPGMFFKSLEKSIKPIFK